MTLTATLLAPLVAPVAATIVSLVTSTTNAAPIAMQFEVDPATLTNFTPVAPSGNEVADRRRTGLYYYWTYGDAYDWTAPEKQNPACTSSGTGFGHIGTHVYRTGGQKTVRCLIIDPVDGYSELAELVINIADPDTVFTANNQTIVVDTTGAGLLAYPNATVVTSIDALESTIKGFNDATIPRRVFFRRGQTFASNGLNFAPYNQSAVWPTVHLLAEPGGGAKPVINQSGGVVHNANPASGDVDVVIQDLVFNGQWDATTETGNAFDGYDQNGKPPRQLLMDGCEWYGHNKNFSTSGNVGNPGDGIGQHKFFLNDCVFEGHRDYNVFGTARNGALLGCRIMQDVDAHNGPLNLYGEIRFAQFDVMHIEACDLYTKGGSDAQGNYEPRQPCIRLDTDGLGNNYLNMNGNVIEGGRNIISTGSEGSRPTNEGTWVIEKNYLMSVHTTRIPVLILRPGMFLRNNVINVPDVARNGDTPLANIYTLGGSKVPAAQQGNRYEFVGNTIIIQLAGNYTVETLGPGTTGRVVENNLIYGNGDLSQGPLSSTPLFVPREKGYKDAITAQDTTTATPAGAAWDAVPQVGAGALGSLTGSVSDYRVPYDDFAGNERVTDFIGAVAPA